MLLLKNSIQFKSQAVTNTSTPHDRSEQGMLGNLPPGPVAPVGTAPSVMATTLIVCFSVVGVVFSIVL